MKFNYLLEILVIFKLKRRRDGDLINYLFFKVSLIVVVIYKEEFFLN
jgi:hypothetical protein